MGIDGGVTGGTGEVFVLSVGNVGAVFGEVLLGKSEIHDVEFVAAFATAHQEVVGLDVAVEEVSGMDVLYSGKHLVHEEQDSLQGELAVAEVEEVFQTGAQVFHGQYVVVAFSGTEIDLRDAFIENLVVL